MMDIVKYGAIATLAVVGALATGGTANAAVLAGSLAVASKGIEQICETRGKEAKAQQKESDVEEKGKIDAILRDKSEKKTIEGARERAKKGLPPVIPQDRRLAGGR